MDHTIVCSAPGAGSNFIASLVADYNGESDLVVYLPENNEYRLWVKPYWITTGYQPDDLYLMQFIDGRWTSTDYPDITMSTPSVSRMHSNEGYIPSECLNDVVKITSRVYNVVSGSSTDLTNMLAAIKNLVLKSILGQSSYLNQLGRRIHNEYVADHFIDYCRLYKQSSVIGYPTTTIGMDYFHDVFLKTHQFDRDQYKEYVRARVNEYLTYLKSHHGNNIPTALSSITVDLDYTDLIVKQKPTQTIFDEYKVEIQQYHQRNVELIHKVCGFYQIPVDFLDDL